MSGDESSDPSLSSEEEDMLLEMEAEAVEGLSEQATVTASHQLLRWPKKDLQ